MRRACHHIATKVTHPRNPYTEMTHPSGTPSDEQVWVCTYCGKTYDEFPMDSECRGHVVTWGKTQLAMRGGKLLGLKIPKCKQFRPREEDAEKETQGG